MNERNKTKRANEEVKSVLDAQVKEVASERQKSREQDLSIGRSMVDYDLTRTTHEAQVSAFKKHEMGK